MAAVRLSEATINDVAGRVAVPTYDRRGLQAALCTLAPALSIARTRRCTLTG